MCNELPDDARAIKCLYRYPEHDDRCRTHSDVCSPRLQVELLAKYVWGGKQGTEGYTEGDWTLTTKQLRIVEVHQQEIASPGIVLISMKVTMLVWRVIGRAAMSRLFFPKKSVCHQLRKLQAFREQKM